MNIWFVCFQILHSFKRNSQKSLIAVWTSYEEDLQGKVQKLSLLLSQNFFDIFWPVFEAYFSLPLVPLSGIWQKSY